MTVDYLGGEIGSLTPSDSTIYEETGAGAYNSSFCRAAIRGVSSSAFGSSPTVTARTEGWFHGEATFYFPTASATGHILYLYSGTTPVVRLSYTNTGNVLAFAYWNGSTWISAGTSVSVDLDNDLQEIDIHYVVASATGSLTLYVSGTPRIGTEAPGGVTFNLAHIASIDNFKNFGTTVSNTRVCVWSQIAMDTTSTIGNRVRTVVMTGAGASTTWLGDHTAIDEARYSDADTISSTSADEVELYTGTAVSTNFTGYRIKAIAVTARAKKGSSGPTGIQLALRSSSTTFFSTTQTFASFGYESKIAVWNLNPATTSAFLSSELSALQFGVKSIA